MSAQASAQASAPKPTSAGVVNIGSLEGIGSILYSPPKSKTTVTTEITRPDTTVQQQSFNPIVIIAVVAIIGIVGFLIFKTLK